MQLHTPLWKRLAIWAALAQRAGFAFPPALEEQP